MKKLLCLLLSALMIAGCTAAPAETETHPSGDAPDWDVKITLSDESIGIDYSTDGASGTINPVEDTGVYTDRDIVYYESGHDFTYGEGEESEAHTPDEAAEHIVVHITRPGTYLLTGSLSAGQIAVDLGEEAASDSNAVVTLILDNVDITCRIAPAIIFYNVYECGDADNPTAVVDTSAAGANVVIADGSSNRVVGSHVAKIYKPDSVVLNEAGTEVEDAKKLHKYDAAFYSRMSMNVDGNDGILKIEADNEGLDSELHLTINGGRIYIESGNDGINTNADGVSVTTINGGHLRIDVAGTTGEGDGIDSNGWLVINGGAVEAYACALSGDAGIDSDLGIRINGGTVTATGNMLDRIEDGGQTHIVFSFAESQKAGTYTLKDPWDGIAAQFQPSNAFRYLIISTPELEEGTYTFWSGDTQYQGAAGEGGHMGGGIQIIERPDWPGRGDGDVEIPPQPTVPLVPQGEAPEPPAGEKPENMPVPLPPEGMEPGDMPVPQMPGEGGDMPVPELPEGMERPQGGGRPGGDMTGFVGVLSTDFPVTRGANYFILVSAVTE